MKKIIRYGILGIACSLSFVSCNKDYLETVPTHQVATSDAFATTDNALAALNGIHRLLYSQIFGVQAQGGQSGNMLYMDIMGEDLVFPNVSNTWLRNEYQWIDHRVPTSRPVTYNYLFYYMIIGNANMIIANVDNAEGPEAQKAMIKGQALVYRGWSYFQMIQLFGERYVAGGQNDGLGLSIVTEPGTGVIPRSTIAEVYQQLNADLQDGLALLSGYNRSNKSHLNTDVAKGFIARVALTQQNYELAAQMAREARAGYPLMSTSDYLGGFNDYSNDEWMWGSRIVADQTNFFYSFFAYISLNYNSTAIRATPKVMFSVLYDQISDTDIRKQLWDPTGDNVDDFPLPLATFTRVPYQSRKFLVADPGQSIGDVPMMRAAEMYLIEAEALARMGGRDGDAAAVLFELASSRDAEYTLSSNTGQALIDEIMIQRRVELWGEGFRFYDIKRTNSPLDRRGGNHNATYTNNVMHVEPGGIRWQFLLPQAEVQNSEGVIVQNPQ